MIISTIILLIKFICILRSKWRKYHNLVEKYEKIHLEEHQDLKAMTECINYMQGVYKNIDKYNLDRKRKVLAVFNDMIADMINNKKPNQTVTKLIIRGRKLNISAVFISQSYFAVPKDNRVNCTHSFYHWKSKQMRSSTNRI